jgi:pimeloyl-ACP methyl ester carboxylesterase
MSISLPSIDRRLLLLGTAVFALAPFGPPARAAGTGPALLDPDRVANYPFPPLSTLDIQGGKVTYALQGPEHGPLIVYFHGWGDDYRVALPLEYSLIDAGYRLLIAHRPGYAGTALEGTMGGKKIDRRTAMGSARVAAGLLDHLHGEGKWRVSVVGTSGGAPTALAFASLYAHQTKALIIQAGVTQPWTDARYVPDLFRNNYLTAFKQFGWAGDQVSQIIFGLLVKLRENFFNDEDKIKALAGPRLADAKADPAFKAVVSTILREDAANRSGELNDARSIFFSKSAYCRWEDIKSPVLIIHDRQDPFVPFAHAEEAKKRLPRSRLRAPSLGGHMIWLGRDARLMHETRVQFLEVHR